MNPPVAVRVFKVTDEDWYPSYALTGHLRGKKSPMLVEVSYLGKLSNGMYRTCIWGADDKGMDYDAYSKEEAWGIFLSVVRMPKVSTETLTGMGFVPG